MTTDRSHLGPDDIAVGLDLSSQGHQAVILTAAGRRLTTFRVSHTRAGVAELIRRAAPERWKARRVIFAFEATGHLWEAVAHTLTEQHLSYVLVNPLATFRVREARQMGRDKRDVTDAEQIAQLLRTGLVTQTQLETGPYLAVRRAWAAYNRLRTERARLKTLVSHQVYGVFPELVGVWTDIFGPGALAVLRLGLTPFEIARLSLGEFWERIQVARQGRRVWRFKVAQVHARAQDTIALPHGAGPMMREIERIVARVDLLAAQMQELEAEICTLLEQIDEAHYLATMPGVGWTTVAGVLAETGTIQKYRHGRQLVKLAGLNPSRHESGSVQGRCTITRRGRAGLRTVVYLATLAALQHNPRVRAHYDRLRQREIRPLAAMPAMAACMTKWLLYAFAVMKRRQPFDVDHVWHPQGATPVTS
jgi:transposase